MSESLRLIGGTVVRLQCEACGAIFPHFIFAGETDSATEGLYSATSCTANELVIAEATPSEWNEMGHGDGSSAERNLAQRLARSDLRIVHLLRVEDNNAGKGMSFAEFQKVYRPPVLIYSCVCCGQGESRPVEELSPVRFKKSGGKIEVIGPFRLLA